MEPERWPDGVRRLVDASGATSNEHLIVDVKQLITDAGDHFGWLITLTAPALQAMVRYQLIGHEPRPLTHISEPAWYAKLKDLPPGGTT